MPTSDFNAVKSHLPRPKSISPHPVSGAVAAATSAGHRHRTSLPIPIHATPGNGHSRQLSDTSGQAPKNIGAEKEWSR